MSILVGVWRMSRHPCEAVERYDGKSRGNVGADTDPTTGACFPPTCHVVEGDIEAKKDNYIDNTTGVQRVQTTKRDVKE